MVEIKCPKCGEIIKIEKDTYNALLNEIEQNELKNQVQEQVQEKEKLIMQRLEAEYKVKETNLNAQNKVLQEKINGMDDKIKVAVNQSGEKLKEELSQKAQEIAELKHEIEMTKSKSELSEQKIRDEYDFKLREKDEQIERWKSYRMGDSTKDLGESLEQYCSDSFNEVRTVAFPNAYFEKDNIADEEGKGDFIFKDYQEGVEIVSIMFEMKNQNDTTKTKHKNEDFFAKLDKNRNSKKCEYAVLVSTLEEESKLYNQGIVDVSYKYPKMFVVRPQFFLPIIGLIRNMAKNSFEYRKQVTIYQQENIDITNFENAVKETINKISSDYAKAEAIYSNVDKLCDDIVDKVNKFRKEFKSATNWIEKAQKQLPNLEIRKLTRNNKTMQEKFDSLK